MIKQFLQIAGVRNEKEFLAKYPTEASFFRAHPEARQLMNQSSGFTPNYADTMPQAMYGMGMAFGGYVPQAANGMQVNPPSDPPRQEDFPDYGSYAAAFDQWLSTMQQQADVGEAMPQGDMNTAPVATAPMNMSGAPVSAPSPYVPTNKVNLKDYKGISVVDFLTAQGVPADFSSRKELASALGISNYRGTATQNKQMMQMIQQAPDILSDYQGVAQPTGNVRKAAARSKNANAAPTTKELAAAKYNATADEYEPNPYYPIEGIGVRFPQFGDAFRLENNNDANNAYHYQSQLHGSNRAGSPARKAYDAIENRNNNNFEKTGRVAGYPDNNEPDYVKRNLQTGLWVPIFNSEEPMMSANNAARAKLAQDMNAREAQGKSGAMISQGRGFAYGGTPKFDGGGEPCRDAQGNIIPCEDQRLKELGSDAYTAMQPFYNTMFQAANKYANPETGMVSPFNSARARLKGIVKHPEVLFMKRHQIKDEAADPYHTGQYTVDQVGNNEHTLWPNEWAEPRQERNTGNGWENFKLKLKERGEERRGRRNRSSQGCYGANCVENEMQEQAMYGGVYNNGGSYTGTWNGNQGFEVGGAYIPDYASSAYGLPQFELGAPIYADGGMSPEEAMMMQQQQQGAAAPQGMMPPQDGGAQGGQFDQQQVIQAIFQMIQQGMPPEQIMQQLVQGGIPEQMAQELIQMVMQQMQAGGGEEGMGEPNGAQQPQAPAGPEQGMQGMPMPGGMARGGITPGWEGEVTMQQLEELRKKGVKFDII